MIFVRVGARQSPFMAVAPWPHENSQNLTRPDATALPASPSTGHLPADACSREGKMHTQASEGLLTKNSGQGASPTLLAMRDAFAPIAFTRLRSETSLGAFTVTAPIEKTITVLVAIAPTSGGEIQADKKNSKLQPLLRGHTLVFDPDTTLIAGVNPPYDFLQLSFPVATLDQLSYDRGLRPITRLRTTSRCIQDPTIYALAQSLLPMMENPPRRSGAFIDSIALAFHAHITSEYGSPVESEYPARGGLTPVQLRRTLTLIESRLDRDVSIPELAKECRLSASHFTRAFRQTTGVPPHRWIIDKRVERAKELIAEGQFDLAQIALACGFFDQSHLTRAFVRNEGCGPGKWRRVHASCGDAVGQSPLDERVDEWSVSGSPGRNETLGRRVQKDNCLAH